MRPGEGRRKEGGKLGKGSTAECISKTPVCLDECVTDRENCIKPWQLITLSHFSPRGVFPTSRSSQLQDVFVCLQLFSFLN